MSTTPRHRQQWKEARRGMCAAALASILHVLPLWLASILLLLPLSLASATEIYHSPADDGAPAAGVPVVPEGGVQPIHLYVDGGPTSSAPGTVCDTGQGDEVCGFTVTLEGAGGLGIVSFSADGAVDLVVRQTADALVLNFLDPVSPVPGPQRLGLLQVSAVTGGSLELSAGEVIGADLGSELLVGEVVATVPEPASSASWVAGAALLAVLGRRRGVR